MDWRLPIADRMNCQRENSAFHSFLNWIHAESTLLRIRFRWTFEPSGLAATEASVSFAKGAASHNQLEFCWNTAGGHLPLSPNDVTDVFCATNSVSEQSLPVLPCPPPHFTKLSWVVPYYYWDAENKPPTHPVLKSALSAAWPSTQVACSKLVMFMVSMAL